MKTRVSKIAAKGHVFSRGRRGAVLPQIGKIRITVWIDTDVLKWLRTTAEREGQGCQTVLNDALKVYISKHVSDDIH